MPRSFRIALLEFCVRVSDNWSRENRLQRVDKLINDDLGSFITIFQIFLFNSIFNHIM